MKIQDQKKINLSDIIMPSPAARPAVRRAGRRQPQLADHGKKYLPRYGNPLHHMNIISSGGAKAGENSTFVILVFWASKITKKCLRDPP